MRSRLGSGPLVLPGILWLFLLFVLIGPVGHYIFQSNLNKVLRQQAGLAPTPTPSPTPVA